MSHPALQPTSSSTSSTSPALKPCPFCGRPPVAESWYYSELGGWQVACVNPSCAVKPRTAVRDVYRAAERDWNSRARG